MIEVLKGQVRRDEYVVEPALVAAAMLARRADKHRLAVLRSQVLVAAQSAAPHSAAEPEPFTGRYLA
jgi:hypothetical protein